MDREAWRAAVHGDHKELDTIPLTPPAPHPWSGLPFPSPGDLPYPGIEFGSATLQVDSLPSEPPGKCLRTAMKTQHNQKYDK